MAEMEKEPQVMIGESSREAEATFMDRVLDRI